MLKFCKNELYMSSQHTHRFKDFLKIHEYYFTKLLLVLCTIEKCTKVTDTIGEDESLYCNGSQAHSKWLICPDGL